MGIRYLDFDLQITPAANGYKARVLNSPAGQAAGDFRLPLTNAELNSRLTAVLQPDQLQQQPFEQTDLKTLGGQLFDALFQAELLACYRRSCDAAQTTGAGLRIRLRLADAPELATWPWEYLYDKANNCCLTLATETPLVHYIELPEPARTLAVAPPVRMLVVIASPTDLPTLDGEQEWQNLQAGVDTLVRKGQLVIERLQPPTLPALQTLLRRNEYHIFHFVGHAAFAEANQTGMLALTDDQGAAAFLSADQLGLLLHNEPTLVLAVLNACEGARTALVDPFAGVAQTLVQQGVPAVVAMQFPISDRAAITFSSEFYAALADGYPVDAAVTEARVALSTRLPSGEWGAPKLFLRAGDGELWRLADATNAPIEKGIGAQIDEKLSVLPSLLQTPAVRNQVVAFRTDFQAAGEQIEILSNYKDLHDLLHNLEFLCFNGLVQELRRFPQDETAVGILTDHELTLQDIVQRLQAVAARRLVLTDESVWIGEILDARNKLHEALETLNVELLSRAVWLLRRVLYRHPTRINERLNAAARALRFTALVKDLSIILDLLRGQPFRTPAQSEQVEQLETGVTALTTLSQGLSSLLSKHDRWQAVDLELRRIEAGITQDLMELEISWPSLLPMLEPLVQDGAPEWINTFNNDCAQLDAALKTQNPVKSRLYFQRIRRQAGNRFYQIDSDLKNLCDELRAIGAPFAAILEVLA